MEFFAESGNNANGGKREKHMENVYEEAPQDQSTSKFRPGPAIPGHSTQYAEEQHAWVIDQQLIHCSVPEYRCLKLLLEHVDRCVPFARLLICLQEVPQVEEATPKQERMRIAHLMSVLRNKMWPYGLDIVSVMNVGYILLSGTQ